MTPRGSKIFTVRSTPTIATRIWRQHFLQQSQRHDQTFRNRNQFGGKVSGPMPLPRFGEGDNARHKDKGSSSFSMKEFAIPVGSQ